MNTGGRVVKTFGEDHKLRSEALLSSQGIERREETWVQYFRFILCL